MVNEKGNDYCLAVRHRPSAFSLIKNGSFLVEAKDLNPLSPPKKKSGRAVSVHTAIGSNVKRLWVAASVKKICSNCLNFRITIFSNYSKNLKKISSKIFSLKIDRYMWLFSWNLLEIANYTFVPKNIFKI